MARFTQKYNVARQYNMCMSKPICVVQHSQAGNFQSKMCIKMHLVCMGVHVVMQQPLETHLYNLTLTLTLALTLTLTLTLNQHQWYKASPPIVIAPT